MQRSFSPENQNSASLPLSAPSARSSASSNQRPVVSVAWSANQPNNSSSNNNSSNNKGMQSQYHNNNNNEKVFVPTEGYLTKLGEKVKNWKKRFFSLSSDGMMDYFTNANKNPKDKKGSINVSGSRVRYIEENEISGRAFCIGVRPFNFEREYLLSSDSLEDRNRWLNALIFFGNYKGPPEKLQSQQSQTQLQQVQSNNSSNPPIAHTSASTQNNQNTNLNNNHVINSANNSEANGINNNSEKPQEKESDRHHSPARNNYEHRDQLNSDNSEDSNFTSEDDEQGEGDEDDHNDHSHLQVLNNSRPISPDQGQVPASQGSAGQSSLPLPGSVGEKARDVLFGGFKHEANKSLDKLGASQREIDTFIEKPKAYQTLGVFSQNHSSTNHDDNNLDVNPSPSGDSVNISNNNLTSSPSSSFIDENTSSSPLRRGPLSNKAKDVLFGGNKTNGELSKALDKLGVTEATLKKFSHQPKAFQSLGAFVDGPERLLQDLSQSNADQIIKQGSLVKRGHTVKNYKTRWFVLNSNSLTYYHTPESTSAQGVIQLQNGAIVSYENHSYENMFCFSVTPLAPVVNNINPSISSNPSTSTSTSTVSLADIPSAQKSPSNSVRHLNSSPSPNSTAIPSPAHSSLLGKPQRKYYLFTPTREEGEAWMSSIHNVLSNIQFIKENTNIASSLNIASNNNNSTQISFQSQPTSTGSASSYTHTRSHQGYLRKLGSVRKNWKTRFMVISCGSLFYFSDSNDASPQGMLAGKKPLGFLTLKQAIIKKENADEEPFKSLLSSLSSSHFLFSITPFHKKMGSHEASRRYLFVAHSKDDMDTWIKKGREAAGHILFNDEAAAAAAKAAVGFGSDAFPSNEPENSNNTINSTNKYNTLNSTDSTGSDDPNFNSVNNSNAFNQPDSETSRDAYVFASSVKEGHLMKLGASISNWKKRYFVLSSLTHSLCYFSSSTSAANGEREKGQINLTGATVIIEDDEYRMKPYAFSILPVESKRKYVIVAPTLNARSNWVSAIRELSGVESESSPSLNVNHVWEKYLWIFNDKWTRVYFVLTTSNMVCTYSSHLSLLKGVKPDMILPLEDTSLQFLPNDAFGRDFSFAIVNSTGQTQWICAAENRKDLEDCTEAILKL